MLKEAVRFLGIGKYKSKSIYNLKEHIGKFSEIKKLIERDY